MENKCTDGLNIKNIYIVNWDKTNFNNKYPYAKECLSEKDYEKYLSIYTRRNKLTRLINSIDDDMENIEYCKGIDGKEDYIALMIKSIRNEQK